MVVLMEINCYHSKRRIQEENLKTIFTVLIYSAFAYLIRWNRRHKFTIMATPLTGFLKHLNTDKFPILQPILMKYAAKCSLHKDLSVKTVIMNSDPFLLIKRLRTGESCYSKLYNTLTNI